jgi:tetratricopeptide (TPR) repeat protein
MHRSVTSLSVATLLVVCLAVAHRAAAHPDDVRTLTMRAAADEHYRALPNWEAALRGTAAKVSEIYEKRFRVRFALLDVVPFTVGALRAKERLTRMMADVPIGEADLLIGFSSGRCDEVARGWARPFDRYALIMATCQDAQPPNRYGPDTVLSHEIGHLFGGFHPAMNVESVMHAGGGPPDQFDDQNSRVIRLMRGFDFRLGILALDVPSRRAWRAIYAEGHQRNNEVNPLVTALLNTGVDLARSGKLAEGEAALHEAIRIDQLVADPHAVLGEMYARRGRFDEAERELRMAKSLDFNHVRARTELGFLLLRQRKDQEAISEFEMVVRLEPQLARARVGYSVALARGGRADDAVREAAEAIRLAPADAAAYSGRGDVFRLTGDLDRAIEDYDQAIRLQPTFAPAWNNRCFTRAIAGRLEAALADCDEALRLRPQSSHTFDSRGLAYLKLGQLDRAIADYDAALRLDPRYAHALHGRGLAKRKKGDHAGAETDLAAARTLAPRVAEDYARYGIDP